MNDEYLSVTQVAQLKGVSRNSVYKAISEGRLSSVRIAGVAVRRADAEAWSPKSRVGRRKGQLAAEETRVKMSEAHKARWQKRKSESENTNTKNTESGNTNTENTNTA